MLASASMTGPRGGVKTVVARQTNPHELINNVLDELGGDWQAGEELLKQEDGENRLRLLQQHFPDQDIRSLRRDEVAQRLQRLYWSRIMGDDIASPAIARSLFGGVLTLGLKEAVRLAQQVVGATADGVMGPQTLRALNAMSEEEFLTRYQGETNQFIERYQSTPMEGSMQFEEPELKTAQTAQTAQASPEPQTVFGEAEQTTEAPAEFANMAEANVEANVKQAKTAKTKPATKRTKQQKAEQAEAAQTDFASMASDRFNVDAIAKKSTSDIWTIRDQLGYASYAQAIAKLIVENKAEPPLTVSIQAPWGQGKTSLMRMIKHRLEHGLETDSTAPHGRDGEQDENTPGTQTRLNDLNDWIKEEKHVAEESAAMLKIAPGTMPCVWFNPLYFQDSKQVWSGLAHAILHQLADKLDSQLDKERFWFRLRMTRINTLAIRRDIHKLILERMLPKGLVWAGILVLMLLTQALGAAPVSEFFTAHAWVHGLPVVGALAHMALTWLNKNKDWALDDKLMQYIREPDYEGNLGLLHLVEHDLDRALELLLGENGRLCVFIDDLDRCTPDTVNNILLAINQFISVQHRKIYFILGMDTHMVAMAIETAADKQAATYNKNRHTSKGYGWRFMEKFVQLPFFIPRIAAPEGRKFLEDLLRTEQAEAVASAQIRELKAQIAQSKDLPELQDLVVQFKSEHNIEFVPEVDASVAAKMIDMTSEQDSETLNKLVSAAMSDLELNPREMKRFLNVARLLFIRVDHNEDVSSYEHMLKIVRASHLILNWPQCLRWLQGNARSYTVKGVKTDPVDSLEKLFENLTIEDYEDWRDAIKEGWGETVADTIAQPDFYTFARRIHTSPPNLSDIFKARIF